MTTREGCGYWEGDEMITEERIKEIGVDKCLSRMFGASAPEMYAFARAIEREAVAAFLQESGQYLTNDASRNAAIREAYMQGQETMRERASVTCFEEAGEYGTDTDGFYTCRTLSDLIDDLEIEEPKST